MASLDVFVDESGETTDPDTPFYLITLIFYDRTNDISIAIAHYEQYLSDSGLPNIA